MLLSLWSFDLYTLEEHLWEWPSLLRLLNLVILLNDHIFWMFTTFTFDWEKVWIDVLIHFGFVELLGVQKIYNRSKDLQTNISKKFHRVRWRRSSGGHFGTNQCANRELRQLLEYTATKNLLQEPTIISILKTPSSGIKFIKIGHLWTHILHC